MAPAPARQISAAQSGPSACTSWPARTPSSQAQPTSTTIVVKTTHGTISFQVTTVNSPAHIVRAQLAMFTPADFGEGQGMPAPAAATDVKDLLRQVAEARQEGLLTDAEYEAKRAEIIRRI